MLASQLTAKPVLLEPVYKVEITVPAAVCSLVYPVLQRRRGQVLSETPRAGTPLVILHGHLPVLEAVGLASDLRAATHGQAFAQLYHDHWSTIPGDPLSPGTHSNTLMLEVRRRKGLQAMLTLEDLTDAWVPMNKAT
jgi:translation elongation factor EF-G